jgi:hypothetical protein
MLKLALTVTLTAACCFAIAAATGLGAPAAKRYALATGDLTTFAPGNFYCQVLTTTEVGCGAKLAPSAVLAYFAPHELEVIKFGAHSTTKGRLLCATRR